MHFFRYTCAKVKETTRRETTASRGLVDSRALSMPLVSRAKLIARIAVLVVGLLSIKSWQYGFLDPKADIDVRWKQSAASGVNQEQKFVFFLHHTGLFPLATDAPIRADTKDEALRQLREEMPSLRQDKDATFRTGGGRGRTYLYLWDVWWKGNSLKPRLEPANTVAFTFALMLLWTAFWWMRRTPWGAALVILLGSNPFQLYHLHREERENIYNWPITTMILLLALNAPLMARKLPPRAKWYPYAAAIASGLVLAGARTIRTDTTPLLLSVFFVCATCTALTRIRRVKVTLTFLVVLGLANAGALRFLDYKAAQGHELLAKGGGVPYTGPVVHDHIFWHPVFCGLGDYDTKYGYKWDDTVAYRYALPTMTKLHPDLALRPDEAQTWSYDGRGKYPVMFEEIPPYSDIIRDKVLKDIKSDPWWYADILRKRVRRILTDTTPVAVAYDKAHWEIGGSMLGILCIPLAGFLALTRRWLLLKLQLFSVPLSVGAFMVFSDKGMTYYGCYHVFGVFVLGYLALESARKWLRLRGRGDPD